MRSFLQGAIAGYGIAIPVGPVAVLIMQSATRRSFDIAAAAAVGVATADLVYAAIAVAFGAAAATAIEPLADELRIVAALVLFAVAIRGLVVARRRGPAQERIEHGRVRTFATFLGITILNPATIAYFVALVLGLRLAHGSPTGKILFVAGAFLASLSWQLGVAGFGTFLRHALDERGRLITSIVGSAIIAGLAVYMLVG